MVGAVGVVGLGKMGLPMARHMAAKGFAVAGCDLDAGRCAAAKGIGATICADPAEVARRSDIVIVVVGFDNEVMAAIAGENGILAGAREGSTIAVASTVAIETMHAIAALPGIAGKNLGLLDIPLCRGEPAAEAGKLLLMAGGEPSVFERCRTAFGAFADDQFHLGPLGSGQVGKMINNLLLWACVSANHGGLKLGEALGVQQESLRQALLKSSGANWALETWLQPRPMPWAEKDMAIVMEEADHARLSLPLCGVIREVIKGIKIEKGLPPPPRVPK